jgi:hypothetical protein
MLTSSLGVAAVAPRFIASVARGNESLYSGRVQRALAVLCAWWIFLTALPFGVFNLVTHANETRNVQAPFARADASLPVDASIADQTFVILPALEPQVFYTHYQRAARGAPRPARTRILATSGARELRLERVDERSLRVSCDKGIVARSADMMLRGPARPLGAGARVAVPGMSVEVERVTSDGLPTSAMYRFDRSLEDPSLVWLRWDNHSGFAPFQPPAIGAMAALPAVDLFQLFAGGS